MQKLGRTIFLINANLSGAYYSESDETKKKIIHVVSDVFFEVILILRGVSVANKHVANKSYMVKQQGSLYCKSIFFIELITYIEKISFTHLMISKYFHFKAI